MTPYFFSIYLVYFISLPHTLIIHRRDGSIVVYKYITRVCNMSTSCNCVFVQGEARDVTCKVITTTATPVYCWCRRQPFAWETTCTTVSFKFLPSHQLIACSPIRSIYIPIYIYRRYVDDFASGTYYTIPAATSLSSMIIASAHTREKKKPLMCAADIMSLVILRRSCGTARIL